MTHYLLKLTLLSDATFGRGDGLAGVVDAEVQHDADGFPYLGGRTLKGLLGAEGADIIFALGKALPSTEAAKWSDAEKRLFGESGAALAGEANLRVGPAQLPADLRAVVARDIADEGITPADVLESLTAIRRQTAMDPESGAPMKNTLRSMRVILRGTPFVADLNFAQRPEEDDLALLAACVMALHRAGTGRNRGRGRLRAELLDADGAAVTEQHFGSFKKAVSA
jgi:CRISPR/Cas system CSM-associated protein Csm3 (group 7 of RAMP superfamily)